MVQRLTYRRRHAYHTKSNRTRIVKTPGLYGVVLAWPCTSIPLADGRRLLQVASWFTSTSRRLLAPLPALSAVLA